jgi:hypothetical protein
MLLASIGFRVQPYKRAEVLSAVDETLRRMRQASGCARSRLVADTEDPNAFTVLSEWRSAAMANSEKRILRSGGDGKLDFKRRTIRRVTGQVQRPTMGFHD